MLQSSHAEWRVHLTWQSDSSCLLDYQQQEPAKKLDITVSYIRMSIRNTTQHNRFQYLLVISHTLTDFFACLSRDFPCTVKIPAFTSRRSLRSIPSCRGFAPIRIATSTFMNAASGSAVVTISRHAQAYNYPRIQCWQYGVLGKYENFSQHDTLTNSTCQVSSYHGFIVSPRERDRKGCARRLQQQCLYEYWPVRGGRAQSINSIAICFNTSIIGLVSNSSKAIG